MLWDCVKHVAEVKVYSILCSPLIYPASDDIIESHQVGWAWIPIGESMTTHLQFIVSSKFV